MTFGLIYTTVGEKCGGEMESALEEMYFFIADISGYTAFMLGNRLAFDHAKQIILNLMEALIKEVKVPMEISKLEGDAIFLFIRAHRVGNEALGAKLLRFFDCFSEKLREMKESNICSCGGCVHVENLNLKIIGHYGKASMDKIGEFMELSGIDVIIPHRLLKNSIQEKRYLLMTDPLFEKLSLPDEGHIAHREEVYEDIGTIPIRVYYPPGYVPPPGSPSYQTFSSRLRRIIEFNWHSLLFWLGLKKTPHFHNLPTRRL